MAVEKPWEDFADQAGVAPTDSLLARTAAGAGVEVSGSEFFARRTSGGPFTAEGDVNVGANAPTSPGGLRYFDVANLENTSGNSGALYRLITRTADGTGLTAANLVKYRNGLFQISNDEPSGSGAIAFAIAGTERARITSAGEFLVGTASSAGLYNGSSVRPGTNVDPGGTVSIQRSNGANLWLSKASGYSDGNLAVFAVNGTGVGSITTTGTATAYNTSSDRRLKTDRQPVENALARLLDVAVWNFAWKATGERTDGFYADELAEVVPCAVTGEKDEMQLVDVVVEPERQSDILGPDGKRLTVPAVVEKQLQPKYQGIDQAKIVPLLTAAVQELAGMVEKMRAELEQMRSDGK